VNKVLSISIAAYNVEKFINKTLESMIIKDRSIFDKLEVLIINDGSKDDTYKIAQKYQTKYPNIFIAVDKENGGYGSTINKSLTLARGKYFKLVDGDDWCDTLGLEKLICFLEQCESDVVVSKYCLVSDVDGSKKIIDGNFDYNGKEIAFDDLGEIEALQMHFLSFKTSILRKAKLKITEKCFYTDVEYILKPIPYVETISFCDALVYMYRVGREGQSVSIKSWQKNIDMALIVTYGLIDYYLSIKDNKSVSNYKKQYIYRRILGTTATKYKIFLSFKPNKKIKDMLIEYDNKVYSLDKKLYSDCHNLKMIRILRKFDFKLYRIISFLYRIYLHLTRQI